MTSASHRPSTSGSTSTREQGALPAMTAEEVTMPQQTTGHTQPATSASGTGASAPHKDGYAPPGSTLPLHELDRLVQGRHHDPHSILGAHPQPDDQTVIVRALRPWANTVKMVMTPSGQRHELKHVHQGVWETTIPTSQLPGAGVGDYHLEVTYGQDTHVHEEAYRFLPTLGEVDLHLIGEGRHEQLWAVLGAHESTQTLPGSTRPVKGTSFAVWAPNAQGVRVVGDFNSWDGQGHPMRSLGSAGVWELFVPGVGAGSLYKYEIVGPDGGMREKADPMAQATECPPSTASKVVTSTYQWQDDQWLRQRADISHHGGAVTSPMSIYEVHLGSWRWGRSYRDLARELVDYVKDLGFTHVEFMPVMEHPFGGSWGYHVTGYYAPTARYGSPDDFRYLVDCLHQAGIGVILDWVPGHFATDEWALMRFDGTALYEHGDPRRGWHPEWGSFIFDVGRREVRNFLVANALYWLEEFHIDGLRVDGVASMLYLDYSRQDGQWCPNQYGGRENLDAVSFLQEVNATAYRRYPGISIIAEESTAWGGVTRPTNVGGLGFGFKWNMGWMHDSLNYMSKEPIHRQWHHHEMTFSMIYAYSENYILPLSHDEVVHGKGSLLSKMPGDRWQQLANLRAYLAFMWAHPGKQLLFMGAEMAMQAEWSEGRELDWWQLDNPDHRGINDLVRDLNQLYRNNPALYSQDNQPDGFAWIDANDSAGNVFSFFRRSQPGAGGRQHMLACVCNFSPVPHEFYRLGLPRPGVWQEVLNTDAELYAGSGVGNLGQVEAGTDPWHGQPASATLRVPPLGTLWLVHQG